MKSIITTLGLLAVFCIKSSSCFAQAKNEGLLATPYPGSVTDHNRGLSGAPSRAVLEARSGEFYSKDPVEKVKIFYKNLGTFEISPEGEHIQVCEVIPFQKVVPIVEKKGEVIGEGGDSFWGGTRAGVTLFGKPVNSNYTVTKVFESLKQAYLQRFINPETFDIEATSKHLEDPELKKVEAQYEHLKWAYYMQTNQKRKDNLYGTRSMDEVIYDTYYTNPAEARKKELEEVQKKYTDAMTKMQFDQATKLGDRMVKLSGVQPDHKGDWDTAIKCLRELDKNAYATKIVIDTHPSKWILMPPSTGK